MSTELIHVGFGNVLAINRVIAIVAPNAAPTKRLIQEGKAKNVTIDMTSGRRTKSVLITDSGHIILAAITPETITGRVNANRSGIPRMIQAEGESE
jgi:extracellular matrix regulatory protein A